MRMYYTAWGINQKFDGGCPWGRTPNRYRVSFLLYGKGSVPLVRCAGSDAWGQNVGLRKVRRPAVLDEAGTKDSIGSLGNEPSVTQHTDLFLWGSNKGEQMLSLVVFERSCLS